MNSDQGIKFYTCGLVLYPVSIECAFTMTCACLVEDSIKTWRAVSCKLFSPGLTDESDMRSVGVTGCLEHCIQADMQIC